MEVRVVRESSQSFDEMIGVAGKKSLVPASHRHLHRLGLSREYAAIIKQIFSQVQYFVFIGWILAGYRHTSSNPKTKVSFTRA